MLTGIPHLSISMFHVVHVKTAIHAGFAGVYNLFYCLLENIVGQQF